MRFRPKAWIFTRACEPVGVGTGVSEFMKREDEGPFPSLMSTARMVLGRDIDGWIGCGVVLTVVSCFSIEGDSVTVEYIGI